MSPGRRPIVPAMGKMFRAGSRHVKVGQRGGALSGFATRWRRTCPRGRFYFGTCGSGTASSGSERWDRVSPSRLTESGSVDDTWSSSRGEVSHHSPAEASNSAHSSLAGRYRRFAFLRKQRKTPTPPFRVSSIPHHLAAKGITETALLL